MTIEKRAARALRASIKFAGETVEIMELPPALVSHLNRTETIRNMRRHVAAMAEFVELLEQQD